MAGHSKFHNIMHRKGAQDAKRAKVFNKLGREITVAAKSGLPDPAHNATLKNAIANARALNMPNDRIKKAIEVAIGGGDGANFEEIRYEGYGIGGVAVVVEALTDNRNRTAGDVRMAFTKFGGNLGETNSVSFMFDRVGSIIYPTSVGKEDDIFEKAVEAGADNVETSDDIYEITTSIQDFISVKDALVEKLGDPKESGFIWKPKTNTMIDFASAEKLLKMIDFLEEFDDVQKVFTNFELSDEDWEKLNAAA